MKASHRLQIIPQLWQESKGIFLAKPGKADYNNPHINFDKNTGKVHTLAP